MVFWRKLRRRLRDIKSNEVNGNNKKNRFQERKRKGAKQQEVVDPSVFVLGGSNKEYSH